VIVPFAPATTAQAPGVVIGVAPGYAITRPAAPLETVIELSPRKH
jgi:hypothetical protein